MKEKHVKQMWATRK